MLYSSSTSVFLWYDKRPNIDYFRELKFQDNDVAFRAISVSESIHI